MITVDWETFDRWSRREASENFEFFSSVNPEGKTFLDRVCRFVTAFLNSSGGTLVIDLPRGDDSIHIACNNLINCFDSQITPRPNVEVTVASARNSNTFDHKYFLVVDVPIGTERPYSFEHKILIRDKQSIHLATRAQILTLIDEHEDPDLRWERQLLPQSSNTDLNEDRLQQCLSNEDVVLALRRWNKSAKKSRFDEKTALLEYYHLTCKRILRNGAIVLFGKQPDKFFPQIAVRAVAYRSEESDSERILDDKLFTGDIFSTIEQCFLFLDRHVEASSEFPTVETKSFRRQAVQYPFAALREAVLNALVHRDFTSLDTTVVIKVMPKRIEIWNSGSFPKGTNLSNLESFRVSRPPNPDIAHVLQRMGYIERLGSGINRIIKQFEKHGMARPQWEEIGGGVRLIMRLDEEEHLQGNGIVKLMITTLEDGEVLTRRRLGMVAEVAGEQLDYAINQMLSLGYLVQIDKDRFRFFEKK